MNNRKVFCLECKYVLYDGPAGGYKCISNAREHNTALERDYDLDSCSQKNSNNHCKEYKRKWFDFEFCD